MTATPRAAQSGRKAATDIKEMGFYWAFHPHEYGWMPIQVVSRNGELRCVRLGMKDDWPMDAHEYIGPIHHLDEKP